MHGWGALGLLLAQRAPARVQRVVLVAALPLLPGFHWHRAARLWRVPVLGETLIGAVMRRPFLKALPPELGPRAWEQFDPGTQRALLRLHRSAPEAELARAGARLHEVAGPALVIAGENDPYVEPRFAQEYAQRLPNATVMRIPNAGHWPWLDDPSLVATTTRFLRGQESQPTSPG